MVDMYYCVKCKLRYFTRSYHNFQIGNKTPIDLTWNLIENSIKKSANSNVGFTYLHWNSITNWYMFMYLKNTHIYILSFAVD